MLSPDMESASFMELALSPVERWNAEASHRFRQDLSMITRTSLLPSILRAL
jgi:hypothetical protein